MKYAPEYYAPLAFKAYIEASVDATDFAGWPVVTWYDPMAVDELNRVVCICQQATSHDTSAGNFRAIVEVGIRTNWTQPNAATDMATHFDRVTQLRDVLNAPTDDLIAGLAAQCADGFTITYVDVERDYTTEVNQGNYYSAVRLNVECHATEE